MCVLASVGACNGLAAAGGGACCFQELDKNKSLGIFAWSLCCRGWLRAQCCLPHEQEACVSISHSCLFAASAALWAVVRRAAAIQKLRDIYDSHDSSLLLRFFFFTGHSFSSDIFHTFLEDSSKSCLDWSGKWFLEKWLKLGSISQTGFLSIGLWWGHVPLYLRLFYLKWLSSTFPDRQQLEVRACIPWPVLCAFSVTLYCFSVSHQSFIFPALLLRIPQGIHLILIGSKTYWK